MELTIITGLSGAGKSGAMGAFEDADFFCIDNLPVPFVRDVVHALQHGGHQRVAVAIDVRSSAAPLELPRIVAELQEGPGHVTVLFLDARNGFAIGGSQADNNTVTLAPGLSTARPGVTGQVTDVRQLLNA